MQKAKPALARYLDLTVYGSLRASHSLVDFETPHFHEWKIAVEFRAPFPLVNDRVADLIFLQSELQKIMAPISGTYLNHTLNFSPTSEKLAEWFWARMEGTAANAALHSVSITLCDLEGHASGKARLGAGD